ncbi:alpha-L-arabinofuranosidase 1-like [Neltuma alba]|uniref:alpha-L-arabinofuranosidase 1-like n=1 Tax=Neltuma alba TaxID=207710 RepID=UPI0010A54152|nr:alpha-L-arabinofuranosidase 1-like [Prosopis alba]XP_028755672.1 alpha-L-arabinofuranosidase 1-like [Prosopis alba]XP_028791139.1 alpha-L-arabinofuranosidase 1-like [Prosopis alba]
MSAYKTCALLLMLLAVSSKCNALDAALHVDAQSGRPIPEHFFGAFFEEINHAGSGGLWAELVNNRGFEAGGTMVPSSIFPWTIIGDESNIRVTTELASPFPRNKVAVKLHVLCRSPEKCPQGVGLSNPGFWGMNVQQGKKYKVVFFARSSRSIDLKVSLTGENGQELASSNIRASAKHVSKWRRMEMVLEATKSDYNSSLQITTTRKGEIWLDQVSAMPMDTYNGHGFRKDLYQMVADLKPKFLRFPGGTYVEGDHLKNAYRWKDTVGPWEKRPGHFNDIWGYWTDDGFGFLEFLQLAEDLGALPVWVFNAGISRHEEINTTDIWPFVQEALDGIEFARGAVTTKWGKMRASLGHPEPFDLRYVAIGNEDCGMYNYLGNYLKFYNAIRHYYPDIKIISNCDATAAPLDHPADLFDFHVYTSSKGIFSMYNKFDSLNRAGPKAFVSEYAVWKGDAGFGTLLSALGEAAFLMGLEKNSDAVGMVCYAPLFVNINDQKWIPDAIVFDSYRSYGIPSYWLQQLFSQSSGATYINSTLKAPTSIVASAIVWENQENKKSYLRIKVVNFDDKAATIGVTIDGLDPNVDLSGSTVTLLTSTNVKDENSFYNPKKIVPQVSPLKNPGSNMTFILPPNSVASLELPK